MRDLFCEGIRQRVCKIELQVDPCHGQAHEHGRDVVCKALYKKTNEIQSAHPHGRHFFSFEKQ